MFFRGEYGCRRGGGMGGDIIFRMPCCFPILGFDEGVVSPVDG